MLPNAVLSSTPEPSGFLPPRTTVRFGAAYGQKDVHYGGIALGDPSQGLQYQLWQARCDGTDIFLSAPNTPEYKILANVGAVWVALALDQNSRVFLAWANAAKAAFYYWYDSTIPGYRTSSIIA